LYRGFGITDGTKQREGKADSGKRTAATCRISEIFRREGGRGPCLGALGVWGLGTLTPFPSPLLQKINSIMKTCT